MRRSFSDINEKVGRGDAVVLTAQEVWELVEEADAGALKEVDVVTTATRGVMSGTYAVFSFQVAKPNAFVRAKRAWINGVPAKVGPCPNERLGILDLVVFGTDHSRDDPDYGGGHLFRDLVEGKSAHVIVESDEAKTLESEIELGEMPLARLFGTRHCFKNYSAFVNPTPNPVSTIFHATEFNPNWTGASVSGCGRLNPIENDPFLDTIGIGTRVLINGADGFVIGAGTRSSRDKPNLAGFADMHEMDPEYMGGFLTSSGPECVSSWAVAIPVLTESMLEYIGKLDREIQLPVMDVVERVPIGAANYGDVWEGVDLEVRFDPGACKKCAQCRPELVCPTRAISFEYENGAPAKPRLDRYRCFNCGLCAATCAGKTFRANLGALRFGGREVPIVVRQSDRLRAQRLAERLKNKILDGSFEMTKMADLIYPHP